ncbi:MAG: XTP/dITP diphosphatase [Nitrospirota bacterium]
MELVLATRNRKKIDEIVRITHNLGVRVLTLDDFPGCPEVEEDGTTFEENATKKAVTVAQFTGIASLADDSGLEVEALNGAPGVLSARYAGEEADDRKNVEALLREMQSLTNRKARFVCCMALAYPGGAIRIFNGYAEGTIGTEPRGSNGFGYDPVFYPAGYTITFAEMSGREKDSLSHRGMALEKLSQHINHMLKMK